jgi:hypothetical protein
MKHLLRAAKLLGAGVALSLSAAASGGSAHAAHLSQRQGTGTAYVIFKAPKTSTLKIQADGTCAIPTFHWQVVSTDSDSMFNGTAKVVSGSGKVLGKMSNFRFSVNRWQNLRVSKPICKPGRYKLVVAGKVMSTYPPDGTTYVTYERVSGSHYYRVTKA